MWLRDGNEPWSDLTSEEMEDVLKDSFRMGWQTEIKSSHRIEITWNKEQPEPFTYRWAEDD